MSVDKVEVRNARGGNARKVDEWTVLVPGGKRVKFQISLIYEDGIGRFRVSCEDPFFETIRISGDNINDLRERLNLEIEALIARDRSENWADARMIEISHQIKNSDHLGIQFSLSMKLKDVEIIPGEQIGNLGQTTVREQYTQNTVLQREHRTDFSDMRPDSGSLQDPEVIAWFKSSLRYDQAHSLARSLLRKDEGDPISIMRALDLFGDIFAERMGPSRLAVEGMPANEDLIDMMREAVEKEKLAENDPLASKKKDEMKW